MSLPHDDNDAAALFCLLWFLSLVDDVKQRAHYPQIWYFKSADFFWMNLSVTLRPKMSHPRPGAVHFDVKPLPVSNVFGDNPTVVHLLERIGRLAAE